MSPEGVVGTGEYSPVEGDDADGSSHPAERFE